MSSSDNDAQSSNRIINGYSLVQTCDRSPEQYDVFDYNQKQVGYIRVRWGYLMVSYPDCGGDDIYDIKIHDDTYWGAFLDEEQRVYHLAKVIEIIDKKCKESSA